MKITTKITTRVLILLFTGAVLLAQPAFSQSKKVYQWRIASDGFQNAGVHDDVSRLLINYTQALSGGRLVVVADEQASQSSDAIWKGVSAGAYQMGRLSTPYLGNKDINMALFSSVPFGMTAPEMNAWFYEGGGLELMQEAYKKYGLLSFPGGNLGNQMGGLFRQPVKQVSDLQGLQMSLSGLSASAMQSLGVDVVRVSAGERVAALKSGKLDAIEWSGPALNANLGMYEQAPYYYTGWHKPSIEQQMLVNKAAFEALPDDLQYALKTAIRLTSYETYTLITHANAVQLRELKAKHPSVKIRAFPRDVMLALKRASAKQFVTLGNADPLSKKIISSMESYQEQIRLWMRIGDQAYLNNSGF